MNALSAVYTLDNGQDPFRLTKLKFFRGIFLREFSHVRGEKNKKLFCNQYFSAKYFYSFILFKPLRSVYQNRTKMFVNEKLLRKLTIGLLLESVRLNIRKLRTKIPINASAPSRRDISIAIYNQTFVGFKFRLWVISFFFALSAFPVISKHWPLKVWFGRARTRDRPSGKTGQVAMQVEVEW